MSRALFIPTLMMLLIAVAGSATMAQQKRPISREDFEQMIQIEPLILQGMVTSVEVKLVTPKEVYGEADNNTTVQIAVTEVTMKIEKIIAGEYDSNEIMIILQEGKTKTSASYVAGYPPLRVNVGDDAIVAFRPDSRGTGLNVLDGSPWTFFRVEGTKLIPYREDLYLAVDSPLEVLAKKAKERELPEVVKASDLICTGTVTKLIDLRSPTRRFAVSIGETLKGKAQQSEITVDMSGVFLSSKIKEPGFQVMLFLKKESSGYRPVAGVNGYYEMHGERLTRGHSVPVRMSVNQLKSDIRMWMEAER
jgi:hypothetical protein